MSYRPISDTMILARPKLKKGKEYYGAYPAGFPERARILLGCSLGDALLHVCGGHARHYLYPKGFGYFDATLDLDPLTEPDFLQDARDPWPVMTGCKHVLIDPPYSQADHKHYRVPEDAFPKPHELLRRAFDWLPVGGRVGILHYVWAQQPRGLKEIMPCIGVYTVYVGQGNRPRTFTLFEKTADSA